MRRLNSVERAWHTIGHHGSANAMRSFRVSGPLSRDLITRAFAGVLRIYPILCCRIHRASGRDSSEGSGTWWSETSGHWQFVPDENLLPSVTFRPLPRDASEHFQMTEGLLNAPINPETMPLIECVVATDGGTEHWISLNFHHAISDGMTCIAVMRCLLTLCDALLESDEAFETLVTQRCQRSPELSPSLTEAFGARGWLERTSSLLRFLARRAYLQARHRHLTPKRGSHKDLTDGGPHARHREEALPTVPPCRVFETGLSNDFVQKVMTAAKKHELTLHAVFSAALLQSLREVLFEQEKSPGFSCISFVNLRKRCTPPISDDAVGCYVSAAFSFHRLDHETSLVSLARDLSSQLDHAVKTEVIEQATLASWMAKALLTLGRRNVATLSISNIGKVGEALGSRNFVVQEVHVHSALSGLGSAVSVGMTSTQGTLALDFTFLETLASLEEVQKLSERTQQKLTQFYEAEQPPAQPSAQTHCQNPKPTSLKEGELSHALTQTTIGQSCLV